MPAIAPGSINQMAPTARERIPYSLAARELLRNTLLDAACDELQDRRWADITMADIAHAAGVSRQTLYKEFGSREDFSQELVLREAERFLIAVQDAVNADLEDPATALSAAFDVFLGACRGEPPDQHDRARRGRGGAAGAFHHPRPAAASSGPPSSSQRSSSPDGRWCSAPTQNCSSECLVRLAISYAALPTGPASMTADSVATLLGPYIERLRRSPAGV